jgi:hypothetical protein
MNSQTLDLQVAEFTAWLVSRGQEILPTRGEWEVLRWRDTSTGGAPQVAYTNKHRQEITKFGDFETGQLWLEYRMSQVEAEGTAVELRRGPPTFGPPVTGKGPNLQQIPKNTQFDKLFDTQDQPWQLTTIVDGQVTKAVPADLLFHDEVLPATKLTITRNDTFNYIGADVTDEKGRWVANVHDDSGGKDLGRFEANCRLIGAAPEMLALLQQLAGDDNLRYDADRKEVQTLIDHILKGTTYGTSTE